jgi:hypothetical protein
MASSSSVPGKLAGVTFAGLALGGKKGEAALTANDAFTP